jgi:chemotaxis protein MotB
MKPALFAAALSVAGCGVSEELYNARVTELSQKKAELDNAAKQWAEAKKKCEARNGELEMLSGTLKGRLSALGQNVKDLETQKGALSTNLEETQRRMAELEKAHQQAELRAAQFRTLLAKFKSMIDSGKLKVEIRNGLMLVKLADNILFDPGKTDLKPSGKEALKEVSSILAGIPGRKFQVAGHTDNQGLARGSRFKTNWELSTARAVEVVHFMIDQGGMPKDRLSAAGFADQLPVGSNDTDEGRRANRRIEIVVLPNMEDLPPMDELMKESK